MCFEEKNEYNELVKKAQMYDSLQFEESIDLTNIELGEKLMRILENVKN